MDGGGAVAPQFKAPRLAEITLPCQACCLAQAYFSIASCDDWNEMGDLSRNGLGSAAVDVMFGVGFGARPQLGSLSFPGELVGSGRSSWLCSPGSELPCCRPASPAHTQEEFHPFRRCGC